MPKFLCSKNGQNTNIKCVYGYFLETHNTHYLQSSACNNDFQVCILTIHIFLSQHLSMLNYFLNFPQHVQKGTVSLENMYVLHGCRKKK